MFKGKGETSSRILYLVELYPLRTKSWYWSLLYRVYVNHIAKKYSTLNGDYFRTPALFKNGLMEMFKIYFKDENHPVNVMARSL